MVSPYSSKKQAKLTIRSREDAQASEFRSLFGRIEDTIIFDLLLRLSDF
jgi:hypothetical protein